jgi:cytochrome P450
MEMTTDTAAAPPGPRGYPLVGSLFDAWDDALGMFVRCFRDHGDLVHLRFGPFDYYFVSDPDLVHHVLVENSKGYVKSRNYRGLKLVLGEGLVTSEGDFWRRQRKLAQPAFHRERLAAFAEQMVTHTTTMLSRWETRPDVRAPLDVHAEMTALTFRIVGTTLFSVDLEGEASAVGDSLAHVMHAVDDYAEALVPIPMWVPTPSNVRFKRTLKRLDDMVFHIIEDRRAHPHDLGKADLLDMLMSAKDEDTREQMTNRQLRDEVMTLVLAGHETTANALTWTWYLLSKHPDVARRLADEVHEVLGDRTPTLADLPRLKITNAILQESMRLYPPVWAFERQALEPDTLRGFPIAKDAIVGFSPFVIHRHPAHWDNPEGFDPDRFLDARAERRHRYAYLPFGGGPRQCIGNGFAMMEAQIIVAMIAQRHRLELVCGERVEIDPTVTLRPKSGVHMLVKPPLLARTRATGAPIEARAQA